MNEMAIRVGINVSILGVGTLLGWLSIAGIAFLGVFGAFLMWQRFRPWLNIEIPDRFSEVTPFNSRFAYTRVAAIMALFSAIIAVSTFNSVGNWRTSIFAVFGGQFLATSLIYAAVWSSWKERRS